MRLSTFRIGLVLALPVAAALVSADTKLKIGSPAPAMKVAKWVKGKPVDKFEKGKVYVVEFWATWCGPCKVSIPHLTEMAKKYKGKATFSGISVSEVPNPKDESYFKTVEDFVKAQGKAMDYNVGVDGKAATMNKTWMDAAGQNGIPTAFIVDQQGTVAWIGHPMADLDEVLGQVIAGKFDKKAYGEKMAKAEAAQADMEKDMKPFATMMGQQKYSEAAAELDKLFARKPEAEQNLGFYKFMALSMAGDSAMNAYAQKLANGIYKNDAQNLNQLAWTLIDPANPIKGADFKVARKIAQQSVDLSKKDSKDKMGLAYATDTLALAIYKDGDKGLAISTQEEAIKIAKSITSFDAKTMKEMTDRLEMFKTSK